MALEREKWFTVAAVLLLSFSAAAMLTADFGQGSYIPWVWHNSGITIRADGTVDPSTAPIQIFGDIYRLTGDAFMGISIQRNGSVLDGNGYRVFGPYYGTGIALQNVTGVTVRNLSVNYFQNGIYLENSNDTTLERNTLGNCGIQVTAGCYGTQILGNNVTGDIRVDFGKNDTISQNHASSISVSWSTNITIINNQIADAHRSDIPLNSGNYSEGIYIDNSNDTAMLNNTVENKNVGIDIWESTNLTLMSNAMRNNQVGLKLWGSDLRHYQNSIETTNTVNNRPVYYLINKTDYQVPTSAGWIGAISCRNLTVENWSPPPNWDGLLFVNVQNSRISNCNLTGGFNGVRFDNVSDITVTRNTLSYNEFAGLYFERSVNCVVTENSIVSNYWFFDIWHGSTGNTIVRNDFIGNLIGAVEEDSQNKWDDGAEGNFWSTFTPVDLNSDGKSDSPCLITASSGQMDNYPLMAPVRNEDVVAAAQQQNLNGTSIAMPREYLNYTLTLREGTPWVTIDGIYPMHIAATMVNQPLPMVYPTPPGTMNMHVWIDGKELGWSNYSDVDPVALHPTDIGNWQMIYCAITPGTSDLLLQIHYEHPVQSINGTYMFLYDLNIEPYLKPSSFNSVAHFVVKLPSNSSGIDVYTTRTSGKWMPQNYTGSADSDAQTITFDVVSEYGKPLWGDIVFVLRNAVPEFPAWIVLPLFAAATIGFLAFHLKSKRMHNRIVSLCHGKN